jgi:hypothetical protein
MSRTASEINIRLTQGKSSISDDTAVPFLVNRREVTAVKKAVGKFSVNDDNTRNVMREFFYKI